MFQARGFKTDAYPCPPEYGLIQAAKYLGVAPWILLEQSVFWRDWAIRCMSAEAEVQKFLQGQGT